MKRTNFSYSVREASTASKNSLIPAPVMLDTPTACREMEKTAARERSGNVLSDVCKIRRARGSCYS